MSPFAWVALAPTHCKPIDSLHLTSGFSHKPFGNVQKSFLCDLERISSFSVDVWISRHMLGHTL